MQLPLWIDYFRAGGNSEDLDCLIDENIIVMNDIILIELVPYLKLQKETKVIKLLHETNKTPLHINWEEMIDFQVKCLNNGANGVGISDLHEKTKQSIELLY